MPKSRRCFLWANGTERASLSGAPPSQTGLTVCDVDWWWARWAESRAWPRLGRAWGARKSRSRQQKSARPSRLVLRFGGVFFEPSPKAGNSFGAGLNVAVDWTLQNEAQPLHPVARLARFEVDLAFSAQELHDHYPIPAVSLQATFLRRLQQSFLQLLPGHAIQARWPARARQVVKTVQPLLVGLANPVHRSLTAQTEQAADRGGFPSRQHQQQASDSNSYPSTRNGVGHAQQCLGSHRGMRNL